MSYNPKIPSIKTRFAGTLYRSRAEARWAVWFNAAKLRVLYEPQCYTVPMKRKLRGYLPDFWVPSWGLFIEIKGTTPTQEEMDKAVGLTQVTHKPVLILWGTWREPTHHAVYLNAAAKQSFHLTECHIEQCRTCQQFHIKDDGVPHCLQKELGFRFALGHKSVNRTCQAHGCRPLSCLTYYQAASNFNFSKPPRRKPCKTNRITLATRGFMVLSRRPILR